MSENTDTRSGAEVRPATFRGFLAYALSLVPLAIFAGATQFLVPVSEGTSFRVAWPWVPSIGVDLSFRLDGLSLLFSMLISFVGGMVFVYAPAYLSLTVGRSRLYAWLMLFMASMLGVVLADNVITLFVFWELTSIASYMLIGFQHEKEAARQAALQALLVTGLGGLLLLAGLLMLGYAGGSYELSVLLRRGDAIRSHSLLGPIIVLILIGAFTKSAQFPFYFWLPGAMEAPAPISAYLHSATMVKAGVYLVARLGPLFTGIGLWENTIVVVGTVTALVGGYLSLLQVDLKRILAYSTVSALGTLMLLLGFGTAIATKAAVVFLVSHALYKSALFLVAGTIDHSTGSRDIRELAGSMHIFPLASSVAVLAAASKAGIPVTSGFLAKETIYEALLPSTPQDLLLLAAVFLVNASFVGVACLVAVGPCFGKPSPAVRHSHPPSWGLILPSTFLSLAGAAIGCFPSLLSEYFINPAVIAIVPTSKPATLKLWHGFNLPILLSVLTLLVGGILYGQRKKMRGFGNIYSSLSALGPLAGYEFCLAGLKTVASWQTNLLQSGKLRIYLLVVLVTFAAVVANELLNHIEVVAGPPWLDVRLYEVCLPVLILASTFLVIRTKSRLTAVCGLGVIGYAIAMLFVMFGAPDLAMTQFAIETLTVILFVSVIYRFPHFSTLSSHNAKVRDAIVAIVVGVLMSGIVLVTTAAHAPSRVSQYFVDNSLAVAKGENMVNVILVDFRGLDTLGEITVLAVAALGIYTLMRLKIETDSATRPSALSESGPTGKSGISNGEHGSALGDFDNSGPREGGHI